MSTQALDPPVAPGPGELPGRVTVESDAPVLPVIPTLLAAAFGGAAAAWVAGGVFRDPAARGIGLLGVTVAAGLILLGHYLRRPVLANLLTLPLSAVVGAALVLPDARGGSATLPSLVTDAIKAGGLLQPPIALDPGWRFILVLLPALITSAAFALAIGLGRPRLAVLLPGIVVMLTALVQPDSAEIVSAAGGIVFLAGGLAAAYGSQLGQDSSLGRDFELNRVLRGGGMVMALVIAMVALSRTGILFPQPNRSHVVPPVRPQQAPPAADRVLFSARLDRADVKPTYRLGVIDEYESSGVDSGAWLLPPFDSRTLHDLHLPTSLPDGQAGAPTANTYNITITIVDAGGHDLPVPAGATAAVGTSDSLQLNPRTDGVRLRDKPVFKGLTYRATVAIPPAGKDLAAAAPPPVDKKRFEAAPAEPPEIVTLLAQAPPDRFSKLQFLRTALYSKVVAAGEGKPVDVSPNRVAQMLDGKEASPYEITAAEALLARWAGVPSRIAFGYYGGDDQGQGTFNFHPSHGATWLETYFTGYGWVPIVGTPPKAKASLNEANKNLDASVTPSDDLGLTVYVPVEVQTILRLYQVTRYWLVQVTPYIVLLLLLVLGYPGIIKRLRTSIRRRWGRRHGPRGRIAVAYAEFRDAANDLTVGGPDLTPLRFLARVEPDPEHRELAWLVTRAFWGDLQRDLCDSDAEAAEAMASSVLRRLRRGQGGTTRVLAAASRASLSEPYTREIPNLWPARRAGTMTSRLSRRRRAGRSRAAALGAALMLLAMGALLLPAVNGLARSSDETQLDGLVPREVTGVTLQREPKAEKAFKQAGSLVRSGRVYTVRHGGITEGSLQISIFRDDVERDDGVLKQLESNIGTGQFTPMRVPQYLFDGNCYCAGAYHDVFVQDRPEHRYQRVYELALPEQRIYLWYPKGVHSLAVVSVRRAFTEPASRALVLALVDHQVGTPAGPIPVPGPSLHDVAAPSPNAGLAPGGAINIEVSPKP